MSHQMYRLVETSPPGAEPLTLDEVKTFLRLDHDQEDSFVTGLIAVARHLCERLTERSLITRSYSFYLDNWPSAGSQCSSNRMSWWDGVREGADATREKAVVYLPKPPLLSVTQINIYAADNTSVVFSTANYFADMAGSPGRIVLTPGALPPMPGRAANGIEIQYKAGYGIAPQNVPVLLRQGMKQIIAHLFEHRGDSPDQALPASGAAALFQSYRAAGLT